MTIDNDEKTDLKKGKTRKIIDLIDIEQITDEIDKNLEIFSKHAAKGIRNLLKDIEINRFQFGMLTLLILSLGSIISIIVENFFIKLDSSPGFFIDYSWSFIVLGLAGGMLLTSTLINRSHNIYSFTVILLFLSVFSFIIERLFSNIWLWNYLLELVYVYYSVIIGALLEIFFLLFLKYTNILERGRIFGFLLILTVIILVPVLILASLERYSIIPRIVPLITMMFFYKRRKRELIIPTDSLHSAKEQSKQGKNEKPNRLSTFLDFIKDLKSTPFFKDRDYQKNLLIFLSFGLLIGSNINLTEIGALTEITPSKILIVLIIMSVVLISIFLILIIGFIFDFWGRKAVISIFTLIFGILVYVRSILESRGLAYGLQTSVITIMLLVQLFILIPISVGELVPPEKYGNALLVGTIMGFGGVSIGIFIQEFLITLNGLNIFSLFFCLIVMFFLVHTTQDISRLELDWPESLYHLYIIHDSGLLLYEYGFVEEELATSDLVSGGIIGLVAMLNEITQSKDKLRTIDQGKKKIMFLWSKNGRVIYVLVVKYELYVLRNKLQKFAEDFEELFKDKITRISGIRIDEWEKAEILIKRHFTRKYLDPEFLPKLASSFFNYNYHGKEGTNFSGSTNISGASESSDRHNIIDEPVKMDETDISDKDVNDKKSL